MKTSYLNTSLFILIVVLFISCSKSSDSGSETNNSSNTTTDTWVKLTATTSTGVVKPNYIIMMFDQPVTGTAALPPILKQVVTDGNGLAYFDLNSMITTSTPTKYYFEAFIQNGANYEWKSITNFNTNIAKGTMVTSSIIVN